MSPRSPLPDDTEDVPDGTAPAATPASSGQAVKTLPENILAAARKTVSDRFAELDQNQPWVAVLHELAVERQGRLLLETTSSLPEQDVRPPGFKIQPLPSLSLQRVLHVGQKVGTLPAIFHRLVEVINSPYASADEAAQVIAADPALSAKLLRLVNSPFYGLLSPVDTISRAVVVVGTGQIVMLAMGATLVTAFRGLPVSLINMDAFWRHSLACGVGARILAHKAGLEETEPYFIAGLLHDIGRLLIFSQFPSHALYLMTEARRQKVCVVSLEKELLGFTHQELGASLLQEWRCPASMITHVRRHHTPLSETSCPGDAVLPAANLLAHCLGHGSSGEWRVPRPAPCTWEALGMSAEELPETALLLEARLREIRLLFLSHSAGAGL